eukprot:6194153-Pleurochrysis_carterae.AAC.9
MEPKLSSELSERETAARRFCISRWTKVAVRSLEPSSTTITSQSRSCKRSWPITLRNVLGKRDTSLYAGITTDIEGADMVFPPARARTRHGVRRNRISTGAAASRVLWERQAISARVAARGVGQRRRSPSALPHAYSSIALTIDPTVAQHIL